MWTTRKLRPWPKPLATAAVALVAVAAMTASMLTVAAPAAASHPTVSATVWADNPTASEYQPFSGYTVNSTGGRVTVRRTGTGAYTVVLEGAGSTGGVAHAVAYGGGPVICTVAAWGRSVSGTDQTILVRCFAATGIAVDSRFVATYTNIHSVSHGRLAYFWTDQAVPTGVRTLTHSYQYDSTGSAIRYERLGTGRYRLHLAPNPGIEDYFFPMAHVTAYATSAVHCQIGWPDSREVWCANAAGNFVDSRFVVTYSKRVDLTGHNTGVRFATGTLYGDWYSGGGLSGDGYNSTDGDFSSPRGEHLGTGRYRATFTGTGTVFGTAFVDAHRGQFETRPRGFCVLVNWWSLATATQVGVNCYAYLGIPANLNARVSFTTWPFS